MFLYLLVFILVFTIIGEASASTMTPSPEASYFAHSVGPEWVAVGVVVLIAIGLVVALWWASGATKVKGPTYKMEFNGQKWVIYRVWADHKQFLEAYWTKDTAQKRLRKLLSQQ